MKEIVIINKKNGNSNNIKENIKEKVKGNIIRIVNEHYENTQKAFNPVFSGLNETIRQLGFDPIELIKELREENRIVVIPGRTRYGRGYIKLLPANVVFNKDIEKWKEELLK